MLTIDKSIENDLRDVVQIVERMCGAVSESSDPLIYYEHVGYAIIFEVEKLRV